MIFESIILLMCALAIAPKKNPAWITFIRNRIKNKKNALILVSGATGSGKSWSCLSIARMLDKNFNVERVVFGLRELMKLITSGQKFPRGTCFVFEEGQIDASSRTWNSLTNRLLGQLLSTFRNQHFILLINTPYSSMIDSQARKLMHGEFEVQGIDYKEKKTKLKPMRMQFNSRNSKIYYKYLRVLRDSEMIPVKSWSIPRPPQWLVDDYETKKTEFTTKLNKDIERQLQELEDKKRGRVKPLTEKQRKILEMMKEHKKADIVAKKLGITIQTLYFHINQAKKKGFTIDNFEEGGFQED